ncbi:MAG TPA: response regulator [Thermoanaerobaculia bacterium]|nr:response regulator [Thermoanaerobaculia bacterium]
MEDDAATRKLLRSLLEERGCDVDEAVDGQQAINALTQHDYAVVLLDIVLPRISGTAVMDFLMQRDPAMLSRVIVVTGLNVDEIRKLFPAVCSALGKPVIPARLLKSVDDCLGQVT